MTLVRSVIDLATKRVVQKREHHMLSTLPTIFLDPIFSRLGKLSLAQKMAISELLGDMYM